MKQKILCVCMTLFMLCMSINVKADIASGTCGMNLTWVLSDDGTLTISGTGAMLNYTSSSQPWGIYRSAIVSAKINMGVTSIGNYAFRECSALTTVTLPTSLTSIGYDAFSNCLSLKSVNIPSNVKSIESWTFYQCSSLKSITIPNSVTSIGDYAFCGCTGLTSILIPNSVTSIEKYAFLDCYSLKSVSIPQSVTSIGKGVFAGCYNITSLIVDKNNKIYDSRINCNAIILTSINRLVAGCENTVIPNSVTSIEDHAFSGCSRLASITIPNSVTSIGERAFSDCSGLKSVYIGNSVMSIGDYAVYGCKLLYDIYIANPSPISIKSETFYDSQRNLHVVSGAKNAYQMSAYWSRFNIIEDNVILTKITLNEKSVSMGIGETKTLTAIVAPEDAVNKNVFWSSSNEDVASVNTNGVVTVKTVGSATITATAADGSGVKDTCFVFVPAATVPITDIIFNSTSVSLKVGEIKDLIANVSPTDATYKNLIWSSSNPSSAWVSSDGKVVGIATGSATITAAAADGSGVKAACKITISGKYEDVITAAIDGTNLIWLLSNDSVLTIMGNGEIPNWDNTANIPWYSNRSKILQVNINEGVTSIGKGAFYKCPNLSSIILPNNLTRIGELSFYQCTALKSIFIPNSVTSIGSSAFRECSGLTSVIIPNSVTSIGSYAFSDCPSLNDIYMVRATPPTIKSSTFNNYGKLHVVPGAKAAYAAASYWKNFNILEDNIIVTGITLNATSASLKVGETKTLTATVSPTNATNKNVTWSSSNTSVATVSTSGVVTAKAAGSAVITATAADGSGKKAECVITVLESMPSDKNTLYVSDISTHANTDVLLSVGMINEVAISALQFDLVTPEGISVTPCDNGRNPFVVELSTARTTTTKHVIEAEKLKDGSIQVLLYGPRMNYEFSGNSGEICTIGLSVGAVADGVYDCTLKKISLSTAASELFTPSDIHFSIIVEGNNISVTGITLNATSASLKVGETKTLTATVTPTNATNKNVTWSSSNTSVATVSTSGEVTAKAAGSATITATAAGGSDVKAECVITVITDTPQGVQTTDISNNSNVVYIDETEANSGERIVVPVKMKNIEEIAAFQFDLRLPTGVTLAKDEDDFDLVEISPDRSTSKRHSVETQLQGNGSVRIMAYSTKNYTFNGTEGNVLNITLDVADNVIAGEYPMELNKIVLSKANSEVFKTESVVCRLIISDVKLGDVTGDGVINVGDLTGLIDMVMNNYITKDKKYRAADINADGELNVGDITGLVSMIMSASAKAQDAADEIETATDANTLYVPAISNAKANSTDAIMSVEMINADPISAFQFDLVTPEGISVAVEDDFLAVELSTARTTAKKHVVESQAQKDGSVRVLLYSNKNYDFSGNSGEVCTIGLAIGAVVDGVYDCTLKNIALSTATSEVFTPANVKAQIGVGMPVGVNNLKTMTTKMYYNLEGKPLSQPQKGINVVRYPDGTTKKVYVK